MVRGPVSSVVFHENPRRTPVVVHKYPRGYPACKDNVTRISMVPWISLCMYGRDEARRSFNLGHCHKYRNRAIFSISLWKSFHNKYTVGRKAGNLQAISNIFFIPRPRFWGIRMPARRDFEVSPYATFENSSPTSVFISVSHPELL